MSALRKESIEFDYGQEILESPKKKRIKKKKNNRIVIDSFKNSAMLAVAFMLGILLVYNYAIITDKKMELYTINQEISELNNSIDEYNIALESIKNTNNIEELAKTYLGMNYPSRKQTVFIDFAYGESNIAEDEADLLTEDENLLYGFIDKVIGFIR